jgi:hypothetical protein
MAMSFMNKVLKSCIDETFTDSSIGIYIHEPLTKMCKILFGTLSVVLLGIVGVTGRQINLYGGLACDEYLGSGETGQWRIGYIGTVGSILLADGGSICNLYSGQDGTGFLYQGNFAQGHCVAVSGDGSIACEN